MPTKPSTSALPDRASTPPLRRRREEEEDPFFPSSEESGHEVDSTPKKRRKKASSVASGMKRNAQAAISFATQRHHQARQYAKEHLICVVTGASDEMAPIQFSHVIAKSVDDPTLTKLEWVWNMKYYTLNVDTRKNLQTLIIPLRIFFDKGSAGWCWLPIDPRLMDRLHLRYVTTQSPRCDPNAEFLSKETFEYTLVALEGMRHAWDIRTYIGSYTSIKVSQSRLHEYPFHTLPTYKLHLRPHFVIFDTGKKLDEILLGNLSPSLADVRAKFPLVGDSVAILLKQCLELYRCWMSVSPPASFMNSRDSTPPSIHELPPRPSRTHSTRSARSSHNSSAAADDASRVITAAGDADPALSSSACDCSASSLDSASSDSDAADWTVAEYQELSLRVATWAEGVHQEFSLSDEPAFASGSPLAGALSPVRGEDPEPSMASDSSTTTSSSEPDNSLPLLIADVYSVAPRVNSEKAPLDDAHLFPDGQAGEREGQWISGE